jgi:S1-C subfamily serine protease
MSNRWKSWAAPVALAAAGFVAVGTWNLAPAWAGDEQAQQHATALSKAFRSAAEKTVPTVVTIEAKASRANVANRGPRGQQFRGTPLEEMIPEELREFLERGEGQGFSMPPRQSMGSGVIIDPSGLFL